MNIIVIFAYGMYALYSGCISTHRSVFFPSVNIIPEPVPNDFKEQWTTTFYWKYITNINVAIGDFNVDNNRILLYSERHIVGKHDNVMQVWYNTSIQLYECGNIRRQTYAELLAAIAQPTIRVKNSVGSRSEI